MFYSDDEDFVLSQKSNNGIINTQSFGYGDDVIDSEEDVVSLEVGKNGNFTISMKDMNEAGTSQDGYEQTKQVFIEDILSDEDVDKMDVEEQIRRSQGPMMNPLTLKCGDKRNISEVTGVDGCNKRRKFKEPVNEDKINELSHKNFAYESKKKMKWAVNMYVGWRRSRMLDPFVPSQIKTADIENLYTFSKGDLCYSLCRFIREIKKVNGEEYPPNTLREIIVMLQMHLQENGLVWKLMDGNEFYQLRNVLDNTMKERTASGLGVRRSSSIISLSQEDQMFRLGLLGDENPTQLLQTVIYMLGLHLALRGGVEHACLRRPGFDCQITIGTDDRGKSRLVYKEDPLQKTNQGGLNAKRTNKVVYVYEASDIIRCPVRLFKKYVGLLPEGQSCSKLYLRPRVKITPKVWYCDQPYGNNKVSSTVKSLCNKAGFEGKFTNHSLRATSASRMYENKVPEQVIKEVTGHKSDCVRIYKRTNDTIRENASNVISGKNDCNIGESKHECLKDSDKQKSVSVTVEGEVKKLISRNKENLSVCQMIKNVIRTRMEMRKKKMKKGLKCSSKVAKKLVMKQKKKLVKMSKRQGCAENKRLVIDVNFNVKMVK